MYNEKGEEGLGTSTGHLESDDHRYHCHHRHNDDDQSGLLRWGTPRIKNDMLWIKNEQVIF